MEPMMGALKYRSFNHYSTTKQRSTYHNQYNHDTQTTTPRPATTHIMPTTTTKHLPRNTATTTRYAATYNNSSTPQQHDRTTSGNDHNDSNQQTTTSTTTTTHAQLPKTLPPTQQHDATTVRPTTTMIPNHDNTHDHTLANTHTSTSTTRTTQPQSVTTTTFKPRQPPQHPKSSDRRQPVILPSRNHITDTGPHRLDHRQASPLSWNTAQPPPTALYLISSNSHDHNKTAAASASIRITIHQHADARNRHLQTYLTTQDRMPHRPSSSGISVSRIASKKAVIS